MDPQNEDQLLSFKFKTRDDSLVCVRNFYSKRGYALPILRSNPEKYVVLRCDRGGHYRNTHNLSDDQRKKKQTTRLMNCPFELYGKRHEDDTWMVEIKDGSHNHEPSIDISGHPMYRRLNEDEKKDVKHMSNAGIPPRQILSSIRQKNPSTRIISKTIYNEKTKIQKNNLGCRSMIETLFEELGQGGFKFNFLRDEVGHITQLFFADQRSVSLTKSFFNVFVMDCTYKTNKYKMPLLDIIGITSFNTSFYSAFVFLKRKKTENYVWALEMFKETLGHENQPLVIITDRELALMKAIRIVFPSATNILCVWHVNNNILAKCKQYFDTKEDWEVYYSDWKKIVYSSTEEEYNSNWHEFASAYREKKDALVYIKKTWLPLKEKFVSAWTERYLHLGNRATSRAEGAHGKLKKYLQVSTGGLLVVKKKISLAIENEFNEIKVQLAREKLQIPHECNIPFFKNLIHCISLFALRELHNQYEMAKKGTMHPNCTGQFMATMGMPCAHQMGNWKIGWLYLNQIHPQWRIDTRELDDLDSNSSVVPSDKWKNMLDNLNKKYLKWPLDKQKFAEEKIQDILNQNEVLFEPTIPPPENKFQVAKKRKAKSSTRRDPSQFEIVEATWQCSSSNGVSQPSHVHRDMNIATTESEIPTTISDDGTFHWIDLNI